MKKICDMDCFHCKYDDCIREYEPKGSYRPYRDWPQQWRDVRNKHRREKYGARKQAGLCVSCGKRANRGVYCDECYLKSKKRSGVDL